MRYVPEFKRNLLSISMSDKIGLTTKIKQDVIKILKRAFTIAKEKKLTPCDRERE